ncbi:MAG: hypothetical protein U5N86_09780 [Planctomycetota bacterium]|nr:hypothetical protein [Planctomycetota bacterium]
MDDIYAKLFDLLPGHSRELRPGVDIRCKLHGIESSLDLGNADGNGFRTGLLENVREFPLRRKDSVYFYAVLNKSPHQFGNALLRPAENVCVMHYQ